MNPNIKIAPEPTLRRLPLYHHYLKTLSDRGREIVSCTHIGTDLRLDPTQVRKDLAVTGIRGRPKVGYVIPVLLTAIEDFLGWNNLADAFLVGAGNLGAALVGYEGFRRYGLNIVAVFDEDPRKIGTMIGDKEILPLRKLSNLARRMKVHLGVLTVPAQVAQEITNIMIEGGIHGIWNFAPITLTVPDDVVVQNENLASGLAVLAKKLATRSASLQAAAKES